MKVQWKGGTLRAGLMAALTWALSSPGWQNSMKCQYLGLRYSCLNLTEILCVRQRCTVERREQI